MPLPTNRRRSQRLFLQVPIVIEGHLPNKKMFSESAVTSVVNAHGALIELGISLNQGQVVILRHARTSEHIEATIKLVTPGESGKFALALEFTTPHPTFWHVSFPPEDWGARPLEGMLKSE